MGTVTLGSDHTQILKDEFESRCRRNPSYSLRAFARDVGVAPSTLCDVLSNGQGLSRATAKKIADNLQYNDEECRYFCDLVESRHARSQEKRTAAKARLAKYWQDPEVMTLAKDSFDFIAEWYHLAILSLMACKSFRSDPFWVADQLQVEPGKVRAALRRLHRLQMIDIDNEPYKLRRSKSMTPSGTSREAMLAFHHDILQKATASIYAQGPDKRELSATMLAIPEAYVPQIKERIRKFRQEICEDFGSALHNETVYGLTMQFFRIADPSQDEKEIPCDTLLH